MTQSWHVLVAAGVIAGLSGCARVQTHVVEMPRVDQELGGNQGFMAGSGTQDARAPRKLTRQVVMTDVELMTGREIKQGLKNTIRGSASPVKGELGPNGRGWKPAEAPVPAAPVSAPAPEESPIVEPLTRAAEEPEAYAPATEGSPAVAESPESSAPTIYVVEKNDTLEKIARKVYGDFRKWPRIYKANRERIKNPNVLRTGLKLTIPPLASDE